MAGELVAIVGADDESRAGLIDAFVRDRAPGTIEAVKRFRNPELLPLFRALLASGDWKLQHRALLALEHYEDTDSLGPALALLTHEERRLREKAAITAIKLWDAKRAKKALDGDPAKALERLRAREKDPHVASCLDALILRARKKLPLIQVHEEHVETRKDGLMWTPFLSGMNNAKRVAPGYSKKGFSGGGGGSAAKCDPDAPWTTPLMAYGDEVVKGTSLQPFANLRGGGKTYHTGQDVGASLDGAGYYAAAEGIVRMIHGGSDMGTMFVVQHHTGDGELVNAVYMHGGETVFVKGGAKVRPGQLLGTMGLGYSIENGGHYSHLHYGLYPGGFATTHNYGYKPVSRGLADWIDPAQFLPIQAELTKPLVEPNATRHEALQEAEKHIAAGHYAKAHKVLTKVSENHTDKRVQLLASTRALHLVTSLAQAPGRAEKMRDLGFPSRGLSFLEATAKQCRGMEAEEGLKSLVAEWKKDADLKTALKLETKIRAAKEKALGAVGSGVDAVREIYQKLVADVAGTCLEVRARRLLDGIQPRLPE